VRRRDRLLLSALVAVCAALVVFASIADPGDLVEALLFAAPGGLLLVPLALGHYLGEGQIERLQRSRFVGRPARAALRLLAPAVVRPWRGSPMARSLAERGPPRLALTHP
jgi:hypothetical protein